MQKVFIQISLIFLIAVTGVIADLGIPKFRNAPFKVRPVSGMYKLGDLNLDDVQNGNQITAYGDFNNDKATDFVSLSDDDYTLNVFVYSSNGSFVLHYKKTFSEKISGIIPADYNYDGYLDLMVITPEGSKQLTLTMLYGTPAPEHFYTYRSKKNKFVIDTPVMPFIFDADGDRNVDLLFAKGSTRYVIPDFDIFTDAVYWEDTYVLKSPKCLDYSIVSKNTFVSPNSNAFVDFNGDCAADIFLTTRDPDGNLVFEIWLRDLESHKFCLVDATTITLPDISLVSIADMDNNGRLDLVYADSPANTSLPMNLHIIYNQFDTDTANPCKLFSYETEDETLGSPFNQKAYNMKIEDWTEENLNITQITIINSTLSNASRLFSPDPTRPPRIRLGDIDVDGFVDIIMIVNEANNTDPEYGSVLLGINNKRGRGMIFNFTETTDSKIAPFFQVNVNTTDNGGNNLVSLSDFKALSVSFFDFDEKGSLGLWISIYDEETKKSSLIGIYNFVSTSNYILKTLALNGNTNGRDDDITKKLGGIYHGASIECIVNDVNGKARIAKASQLGQTGYTALELPYAFIGLGRTNNYVQDFTLGITQNYNDQDLQRQVWTPIIPNSQLIVNTILDGDWTLDVYVSPMSQTWLVALITVVILILLAIVIFVLHLKERREDKKKEETFMVFA